MITSLERPVSLETPAAGRDREGLVVARLLGRRAAAVKGPTLVCIGGLHGNEPAGVLGLQRVLAALEANDTGLRGCLIALAGNRQALAVRRRYVLHDLNRRWQSERVERLRAARGPLDAEDLELRELDQELQRVFAEAPGEVVCLDLHTFSGPGHPFITLDDALPNRELAVRFPAPVVLGLEEELAGTLSYHLTRLGITNFGFESGQHDDPRAVDQAEDAIWITLELVGVVAPGSRPEVAAAIERTKVESAGLPDVVEVRFRHPVVAGDGFRMRPGFESLQEVGAGQVLADDHRGEVRSPMDGLILMPLYQEQGEDGFFLVRAVRPIWLQVSAMVRRWHLERFLHLLPGVRRHPDEPGSFTVDRRYARVLALELFHLLGFRRTSDKTGRFLKMTRRADYRE